MAERYVDAAYSDGVNRAFFFVADQYVIFDYTANRTLDGVHPLTEFPLGAASGFPSTFVGSGPSNRLDAALRGKGPYSDFAYFFRGSDYMRMRTNPGPPRFDPPESGPITLWNLPSSFDRVEAAFNGALNRDAFCYLFKGNRYVRYIWADDRVDANYPKTINNMVGVVAPFTSGLDAAVDGAAGFSNMGYLFKDESYLRFQWMASGEPHAVGTARIQGNWLGLAELLLAAKAKSQGLEWLRSATDRLGGLIAGTLSAADLALVTLALATHFHTTPADSASLTHIRTIFQRIQATLLDSARMFRFRTDAEAIADLDPQIDAAYVGPMPPSSLSRMNFTRNFPRRTELNRASSVLHEAVHVHEPTSNTSARHISEWYVSPALAPTYGLAPIFPNDPAFATRYDLMTASDAIHNPASYATFARHIFFRADRREAPER